MKKIRLYLLGFKGFRVLESLHNTYGKEIFERIIIGRDDGIDNDYYNEIKDFCEKYEIQHSNRKELNKFEELYSDYAFAIGWKWLIETTKVPRLIILHDSILPNYRGFNPLVTALINGDKTIGVTALYANEDYDKGKIISISKSNISYPIKIEKAIEIVTNNYIDLVRKIVKKINAGKKIIGKEQNESLATYSLWRDEEDYKIDWNLDASYIMRFIDAVGYPYKGASTVIDSQIVRIFDAEVLPDLNIVNRVPGKVIFFNDKKPVVVCGKGLLKINNMVKDSDNETFNLKKLRTRFK